MITHKYTYVKIVTCNLGHKIMKSTFINCFLCLRQTARKPEQFQNNNEILYLFICLSIILFFFFDFSRLIYTMQSIRLVKMIFFYRHRLVKLQLRIRQQ